MKPASQAARAKSAKQQVDRWNRHHQVGTPVLVQRDNGEILATKTRSEAAVMASGVAVVWVEGIAGCYLLDRVRAIGDYR